MNKTLIDKPNRRSNRSLSLEEKRKYCIAWEESGTNQPDFCKVNGISKSVRYQWSKQFKKEDRGLGFFWRIFPQMTASFLKSMAMLPGYREQVAVSRCFFKLTCAET